MLETYSAATRLVPLLGYPIEQAKSPRGLTAAFATRGADIVVVPVKVPPASVDACLSALDHVENLAGVLATVPHKFALARHADHLTPRAAFHGSANVMRRDTTGGWVADMLDGLSMVKAIEASGGCLAGQRALLVGAGGAGGAIAHEVLVAGAAVIAVHDTDPARRDDLVRKLGARFPGQAITGSPSPAGFGIVINATPLGMRAGDDLPVDLSSLTQPSFIADVVTAGQETPLLRAARSLGCLTCSGHDMFESSLDLMSSFFLQEPLLP